LYPRCWATIASPTPVLPDVGSTMVPPGLSRPRFSASSIILTAMRSLELPPGFRYSILASTMPAPSGTTEFSWTRGVLPMSSLTCRAYRMPPWSQTSTGGRTALPGGLADVLADLPQRPFGLRHERRRDLEDMHLTRPHPDLHRDPGGGQPARRLAGVTDQRLGAGHVDQGARQPRLDVVQRLVHLLRAPVGGAPLRGLLDELDQRRERPRREHRVGADVRMLCPRLVVDLEQRRQRDQGGRLLPLVE